MGRTARTTVLASGRAGELLPFSDGGYVHDCCGDGILVEICQKIGN